MKNYYFNPRDYGSHWTILAESKERALEILKKYLEETNYYFIEDWQEATVDNLPDNYVIDEYEFESVISGEFS